jgi:hypothetical protein
VKSIKLKLPREAKVVGELLKDYSQDRGRLSEDILQITLPDGHGIDVGWRPEFDVHGHFQIVVFKDEWENHIGEPVEVDTPTAAATVIEETARRLSQRKIRKSATVPT